MKNDYKIVIVGVVDGAGHVLMIRRVDVEGDENSGKWEFPSGHVDPGERPDVAAPREVFEETGFRVYLMPWKIDVPTKKGRAAHYLGFVGNGDVKPKPTLAEDEHDAYRWVKPDNLDRVKPSHKNMRQNLNRLLKHVNYKLDHNGVKKSGSSKESVRPGRYFPGIQGDSRRGGGNRPAPQEVAEVDGDQVVHQHGVGRERSARRRQAVAERGQAVRGHGEATVTGKGVNQVDIKRGLRKAQGTIQNRMVRQLPGAGEDLKEAILVGDEVEIFLKEQTLRNGDEKPEISGIIDKRNRNTLWLRDVEAEGFQDVEGKAIAWKNDGNWAFIRVYRDPDQVIHYINGNPYDPDDKTVSDAKGLGLILESEPPDRYESVWALMRNETPDLDKSVGQAPQSLDVVAPFMEPRPGIPPILHQVREVLRGSGIEPDMVNDLGGGRVLILTQDSDLKRDVVRVLKNKGVEIKAGRMGGLVVSGPFRRKAMGGTTTIPIATDDELMRPVIEQRKRRLREKSAAATVPFQANPSTANKPGQGLAPQLSLTLPSQKQQMNELKGQYGQMKVNNLPGDQGTQLTFTTPQQLQKFQQDLATNTNLGKPVARRSAASIQEIRRLCKGFRKSLAGARYSVASEILSGLARMGVGEEEIIRSRLASRDQWAELHYYSDGAGEVEVSRLSRRASRQAPLL